MVSPITGNLIVCSKVFEENNKEKHQCSASHTLSGEIHRARNTMMQWRQCHFTTGQSVHSLYIPMHYNDVTMGAIASQITSLTIVYLTDYSGADKRKHESSASLAFVLGIHRGPVNSPHKWPVTRKMFPFDDVIMENIVDGWRNSHPWCNKICCNWVLNYCGVSVICWDAGCCLLTGFYGVVIVNTASSGIAACWGVGWGTALQPGLGVTVLALCDGNALRITDTVCGESIGQHSIKSLYSTMTSSNGTFSALLALCAGNSPVIGEFPSQRPVTRTFDFCLWSAPEQTVE